MITSVADTHTLIWYVYRDARLSQTAKLFMEGALEQGHQIAVSAISMIEMTYLIEKNRIASETFSRVARALDNPESGLVEIPVDLRIARTLSQVDVASIPDMPDRIIAATAIQLKVPVISRDGRIQLSSVQSIW